MLRTLWELPVNPTDLFHDPKSVELTGRRCELSFSYEGDTDDNMVSVFLVFEGVEAYRCTFLSSCNTEMVQAYGALIDLGKTPWLAKVLPHYLKFRRAYGRVPQELRHFMIYFDDGPCYELICTGFRESSKSEPYPAT